MDRTKITEEEWQVLLRIAERLGIDIRSLGEGDVRFHDLEMAGHALGRVVAQATTERLAEAQAERVSGRQACPTCGRLCVVVRRRRPLETVDGPIELCEPVCQCPACRRAFFPSASGIGAGPGEL